MWHINLFCLPLSANGTLSVNVLLVIWVLRIMSLILGSIGNFPVEIGVDCAALTAATINFWFRYESGSINDVLGVSEWLGLPWPLLWTLGMGGINAVSAVRGTLSVLRAWISKSRSILLRLLMSPTYKCYINRRQCSGTKGSLTEQLYRMAIAWRVSPSWICASSVFLNFGRLKIFGCIGMSSCWTSSIIPMRWFMWWLLWASDCLAL